MALSDAEKIQHILIHYNLKGKELANKLGLKNPENIYQIIRGRNNISKKVLFLIQQKFPLINEAWLKTGEGEMLRSGGASLITNEDWATTAAKNMLNEGQEDYNNHSWTAPANENDSPQSLHKRIREMDAILEGQKNIIEGLKKELLSKEELLKAKEEIIELLKKNKS